MPSIVNGASASAEPGQSAGVATACVAAELLEMAIPMDVSEVSAGQVTFLVSNTGAAEHEFVLIATDLAADQLPVKDGVVDETQVPVVTRTALLQPGEKATVSVDLPAGHYVVICNVPGHYLAGMHTEFTVR
jgi:uncharacterized cupredoxin-like copper-binding protein